MITIMISGRRPQGQDLETFYREFSVTHVNLMRKARCERFISRYIQNKTISAPIPIEYWVPIDPQFDSQASLIFKDFQTMEDFFNDREYNEIIKPHEFTDPIAMTFELGEQQVLKQEPIDEQKSIKIIYYLKAQARDSRESFRTFIDETFSKQIIRAHQDDIAVHLRSHCLPLDPKRFENTAFQNARISQYNLIEELWFNDFASLQKFHQGSREKLKLFNKQINFSESFSLLVKSRTVFGQLSKN